MSRRSVISARGAMGPTLFGGAALAFFMTSLVLTSADDELVNSKEWDIIIFTQHWPAVVCHEWKEKKPAHSCSLPSQKNAWTVHGVWPSKLGTRGPNFCNNTWHFELKQLDSIEGQMLQYWTNIEKDTPYYSFWEHEWMKHGTCAASLVTLNSEVKYFAQGLRWLQLYSMGDILAKSGILPNDTAHLDRDVVYAAIQRTIGKNPSLHCYIDPHTGTSYLFQIEICFDKNLSLINCDGVKFEENNGNTGIGSLNHCDPTKQLIYPSIVPPTLHSFESKLSLIEIFKLITWLRWFTL